VREQRAAGLAAREEADAALHQRLDAEHRGDLLDALRAARRRCEQRAHGGAGVDGVLQVIADVVARVGGAQLALRLERDPGDPRRR
jgi:hypothetical protein